MEELSLEVYTDSLDNVTGVICFEDNIPVLACLRPEWLDSSVDALHHHLAEECETNTFKLDQAKRPPLEVIEEIISDSGGSLVQIDHALISTMGDQVHIKNIRPLSS